MEVYSKQRLVRGAQTEGATLGKEKEEIMIWSKASFPNLPLTCKRTFQTFNNLLPCVPENWFLTPITRHVFQLHFWNVLLQARGRFGNDAFDQIMISSFSFPSVAPSVWAPRTSPCFLYTSDSPSLGSCWTRLYLCCTLPIILLWTAAEPDSTCDQVYSQLIYHFHSCPG